MCVSHAPVAQLDRVSGYEPEGRGFESLPAYQKYQSSFYCSGIFIIFELLEFEPARVFAFRKQPGGLFLAKSGEPCTEMPGISVGEPSVCKAQPQQTPNSFRCTKQRIPETIYVVSGILLYSLSYSTTLKLYATTLILLRCFFIHNFINYHIRKHNFHFVLILYCIKIISIVFSATIYNFSFLCYFIVGITINCIIT